MYMCTYIFDPVMNIFTCKCVFYRVYTSHTHTHIFPGSLRLFQLESISAKK